MTTQDTNPAYSGAQQAAVINGGSGSCVNSPGYGYNSTSGLAYLCAVGTYSAGYTQAACSSCGTGLLTNSTGSTSYSSCCEWRVGRVRVS
jgi:hypothetical protein